MSSLCLHAIPEALAPLGNSIVDNPSTHSRPHTRLHSSHIMVFEQSRFESGPLKREERGTGAGLPGTNP